MPSFIMVAMLTMASGEVLHTTFPASLNAGRKPIITMSRCVSEAKKTEARMNAVYAGQKDGMFSHIKIWCEERAAKPKRKR